MPLKNLLKKKDKIKQNDTPSMPVTPPPPGTPEFRFVRTDTTSQEVIQPPAYGEDNNNSNLTSPKRRSRFHRLSNPSSLSGDNDLSPPREKSSEKRLSQRLHLDRRSRSSSVNIPDNLPKIEPDVSDATEREAQWEQRATLLAQRPPNSRNNSGSSSIGGGGDIMVQEFSSNPQQQRSRSGSVARVNDPEGDVNIQEAIRLHEAGDLPASTAMFKELADPSGANNALSQVLFGLALRSVENLFSKNPFVFVMKINVSSLDKFRHGWGCSVDTEKAVKYLSAAASNSASVESEALQAGLKKGGAAKGELVLAIFELANCFRHGWGVAKDPAAARQYYETAANLGDTDAMNEAAWCFLEGFGGKKDKVRMTDLLCNSLLESGSMDSPFGSMAPYIVVIFLFACLADASPNRSLTVGLFSSQSLLALGTNTSLR
ncbi:hypothetical protein FQN54_003426 [Arachnomyces sp. PD_36]|nr:hypothetical protein FQN54_003426 [Arachnomyces sp. PD_36]